MRKFICSPFGEVEVDLDDPKTYEHLPQNIKELRQMMLAQIGYAYCYMKFWHKDTFGKGAQKKRIKKLIKTFTNNEKDNYNNILWYQEQIFLFQDEIENMC